MNREADRMTAGGSALGRRKLFTLAAAGALAGLAGCGTGSPPPRTFRWLAIPTESVQSPTKARAEYAQRVLADYERTSGWQVIPQVTVTDIDQAMAKLLLQASQHRAPEVAAVDSYLFPRFARYANDLSKPMAEAGVRLGDWFPQFHPVMASTGQPRSLMFETDVRVLFCRKDLVDRPPASWDELLHAGRKAAAHGKQVLFAGARSEDSVDAVLWPFYWSQGGQLLTADGRPGFAHGKGRQAMVDALAFIRKLITEEVAPQRVATIQSNDDINPDVVADRVSMFIGGSWQASQLQELVTNGDFAKDWTIGPIPSRSGQGHTCMAGGWTWASFAKDPEVARESIRLLLDGYVADEGMARWCTVSGNLPPRSPVYRNSAYHGDAFTELYREHLARYARMRPLRKEYQQVSQAMQIALSSVTSLSAEPEAAVDAALAQIV
ncbi:extracellular solute-binding protein [Sciscionella sediminilitoris]|uniref:extracellular solute-binding protein n=1 Tax=Sciscionella sediminilitoris TaxID=1445613 RepID=UPI0012E1BEC1|nr:extracellular solute-binding protein [Sciscionella sp. SE31]